MEEYESSHVSSMEDAANLKAAVAQASQDALKSLSTEVPSLKEYVDDVMEDVREVLTLKQVGATNVKVLRSVVVDAVRNATFEVLSDEESREITDKFRNLLEAKLANVN